MKQGLSGKLGVCTAAALLFSTAALFPSATPTNLLAQTILTASAANPITGAVSHNFTTNGLSSSYFDISGNLSKEKGTMYYNNQTLTQCLKMETATSISFTTSVGVNMTLAVKDGTTLYIDSVKTEINASGNTTVSLGAGSHTIAKGNGTSNLYYIDIVPNGSNIGTTAPQTTTAPTVYTTAAQQQPTGGSTTSGSFQMVQAGGWNECLYGVFKGISDADVTGVSYSGPTSGKLSGDDLAYLVRNTSDGNLRVDIPGLSAGTYTLKLTTAKGNATVSGIQVAAQDRSGYAHFNYTAGVGAYNDNGTLKADALVLYVTNDNKNTVTVKSKDGTTVTGIGNILNSNGAESSGGKTSGGGAANSNKGIIKKLAADGTPLVIRIIGNVTAPNGLTAYDSVDYGGSVGDNGFMARMKSGKDITIEGIGTDACINGWGFHFIAESSAADYGKSFEVRNIAFRNVPEDCIGMEGVQSGDSLTAPVERCWVHNNEFYKPTIANPAESDKDGGDGACDFKRGMYFTNSYNYYEGYHKTNLVGASDSNYQYHLTYHHNYWKNCESRGPLGRQANIHMYNNIFEGQTSYCQNTRANCYIFSEYNLFESCKSPQRVDSGAIKSYRDTLNNCTKDMQATVVSDKNAKVTSGNKFENFDTNSSVSYIPSGNYNLQESTSGLKSYFATYGGVMKATQTSGSFAMDTAAVTTTTTLTTTTTTTVTTTMPEIDIVFAMGDVDGNGTVKIADVVLLSRYINEEPVIISAAGRKAADFNYDNILSSEDVTAILRFIARL